MSRQAVIPAHGPPPLGVVEAKLGPARARPRLVSRQRLLDRLDRMAPTALTLVDAPVGFGKSVLVEMWVARRDDAVAWVSLEPGDNDPARLWIYLSTAVDRIRPGLGRSALALLRSPGAPPTIVADALANGVQAYGAPMTIVLDDAHVLSDESCWRSLERFVLHLPPGARLVMTTRSDPPFRLGRLRAVGALGEIRASDLAFTTEEAHELLVDREGIALDTADVELLVERTEGWPAGLYLAALWLRDLDDPSAGVRAFHGDHRHVVDYLTGEVLDALDDDTRRFLFETSVLGVFDAAMCDSVLGRTGSAERLRALERENGFLIALGANREWYRYHHLFRELLVLQFAHADPAAPARAHRGASAHCLEHGHVVDALDHAAAADDPELVAAILAQEHRTLLRSGQLGTLLRWCAWLPEELLVGHPEIPLSAALAGGLGGREAHVRHRLTRVAQRSRATSPATWTPYHEVALALVRIAWIDEDVGTALDLARATVGVARAVPEVDVGFLASFGFLLYLADELDEARSLATEAIGRSEAAERPHGYVNGLSVLALVAAASGRSAEALDLAGRALATAEEAGVDRSSSGGMARVARAVALRDHGKLLAAEREAVEAERLQRCPDPEAGHLHALLVLADVRARRGRIDTAEADLAAARGRLAAFSDAGMLEDYADAVEATLARLRAAAAADVQRPSGAELTVLRLLSTDLSQREIGAQLYLSVNTVKTHMRVLYRKLGVTSRAEAVGRATERGLLDPTDPPA